MNPTIARLDSPRGVFSLRRWTPTPAPVGSVRAMGSWPPRSMGGGARLGQTNQEWYRRAKAAVAQYQGLLVRTSQVAARAAREEILRWVGDQAVAGTPAYRYASVVSDLQFDVERFSPVNVDAYSVPRRRGRVEELESMNQEFARKVVEAESFYGTLPPPQVVTVPGPGRAVPAPADGPDLTVPLMVAGGGLVAAFVLGLI